MTITVELPPEVESRFKAEAEGRGVSVAQLVEEFLIYHAPAESRLSHSAAEDLDRAFEEAADLIPNVVPPVSDTDLSRESIYTREDDWNR
jgi:hypothetical protein